MKKIKFIHLSLLNFCGIREAEYDFGEKITTISGSNGKGKTTIANAITYALFGTDINGSTFEIKTYDKDNKIIPEIEHSVELTLQVETQEGIDSIKVKRTLVDSWKDDSVRNSYKYFLNDDVCTAGDFKHAIDSILPETTFRLTSSPTNFVSRPWQEQRKILEMFVPDVTPDDITKGDEKFDFVLDAIKRDSVDKYLHHLRYKRKEVQEQLDKVPVRISELNKALPEKQDWIALAQEKELLNSKLIVIDNKMQEVRSGGAESVIKAGIRQKIDFANKRKDNMEIGARNTAADMAVKHQSDVISTNAEYHKASAMVVELQGKMDGFSDTEINIKKQLEEIENKMNDGSKQYESLTKSSFSWDEKDSFCPTCGQPLPLDQLAEIKKNAENKFNEDRAEKIKELMVVASDLKKERQEYQSLLDQLSSDRISTTNQLTAAHKALKDAERRKKEVDEVKLPTYLDILSKKEEYLNVLDELKNLEEQLGNTVSSDNTELLDGLMSERESISIRCNEVLTLLAKKEEYERIDKLISDAESDKMKYQEQIDDLDDKIVVASEYYQLSCSILEDRINNLFSYVKWTLFRIKNQQTGEKDAYCECYHDGVPYRYLNGAAKINAGIDIANTIAEYYDVSVPMILDECESNLSPLYKGGQQIRLAVAPNDQLAVSYED